MQKQKRREKLQTNWSLTWWREIRTLEEEVVVVEEMAAAETEAAKSPDFFMLFWMEFNCDAGRRRRVWSDGWEE